MMLMILTSHRKYSSLISETFSKILSIDIETVFKFVWLFRCSTFLIKTEHALVSKEQVSYISESVGTCGCCPLTSISARKEARLRNHPSLKWPRLYIVIHVKTFNCGCVMDIYTAVENLGHPGSRPTEEASYRFLLLLVLTVHLFYVFSHSPS